MTKAIFRWLAVAGGAWLVASPAVAAAPARAMSSHGAPDVSDPGRGPCAIAGDYDWGWCYAKYSGISDPADCEFDDASEEFIAGCMAFAGEDES